jgi:16S rRNA (cytosine1402-N4)-methyltransferase
MKLVDCTFGEGGHAEAMLDAGATVLAIDADQAQIDRYSQQMSQKVHAMMTNGQLILVRGNYEDISTIVTNHHFSPVDAVLFDLGLSMNQIHHGEGYSFQFPHQPLDLVIDSLAKQKGTTRAADVVGGYTEEELETMFSRYAELTYAPKLARGIVAYRKTHQIQTVGDFINAIEGVAAKSDYAAIFQALRVEVNDEYTKIIAGLEGSLKILKKDGKIAIISFHSGEDRLIKNWARGKGIREVAKVIGKNVSSKSYERSAILRIYNHYSN